MQIKVTRTLSNPDVSLIGIDLNDRFKQFAIKYGKQLAMNIFGKDLPIDKLFGSGTGAGGATDYKSQMKNVANKYLQKLVGEQTSIDGEKNKYLAEIQKAVKGSGGTAPTQRVRNIFRR
jgi:hypothetical protein